VSTLAHTEQFVRPHVRGKFLFAGDSKLYVRGVTYGTFRPADDSGEYPDASVVAGDFRQMSANGINAIRTYKVPPRWLLDAAQNWGLRVMVGLPWEQHVTFLDDSRRARSIEERVRAGVRQCAGHPAVLCYVVGNEIPASIVRWHGRRRIERFIEKLYRVAKEEDREALVTYVNFPTTEYLELPFLDLACFNVYLESQANFEAYLARLQNLAGNRPLLMTEIGLDSRRNGEEPQARSLERQLRSAFAGGCAGTFVFSWTDEWHRGGCDIEDWDFGLTRRDRSSKPALEAVQRVYRDVPFSCDVQWPRISVVLCTYNGNRTIAETLRHLEKLDYSNFEVIVVDDGSTDGCADQVKEHGFRLIRIHNSGLGSARNTGLQAATGEIVAYIDDDAYPDRDWLKYLALTFLNSDFVGVGGPNIPPPGDGWMADCIANSPGGPIHVLLSDREAEHIPGCNMAFRKSALVEIGGFDEVFRVAGDDVDICWSLQKKGWKLGFSPAAVVWHHRRNSIRTYWKQQRGYGRSEALLEKKWPEKYNAGGHVSWAGKVYGNGLHTVFPHGGRIYQGQWGTAPFQRLYQTAPGMLSALILTPEWYLIAALLGILVLLGVDWKPLLFAAPLWAAAIGVSVGHAAASGWRARPATPTLGRLAVLRLRLVSALLHVLQPLARLLGRVRWGLTPWRRPCAASPSLPWSNSIALWSEVWESAEDRLRGLESSLKRCGAVVHRGGNFDHWDLQVRGGLLGSARLLMAIEEHGQGRQLTRIRFSPTCSRFGLVLTVPLIGLTIGAGVARAWIPCAAIAVMALELVLCGLRQCGAAKAEALFALDQFVVADSPAKPTPARGVADLFPMCGPMIVARAFTATEIAADGGKRILEQE
jgi:glycosyltransferase involved in cell wall biosynthesis